MSARLAAAAAVLALALSGCASGLTIGASLPVGGNGGVGVVIGPDGRVHTRVGVSVGGGQVSVGGTVDVPVGQEKP